MRRVAVIGYGNMGRNHARVLSDIEDVELVGVIDPSEANRQIASRKLHCPTYADLNALLEITKPDLAIIATPTKTHHNLVMKLLDVGVNCLVEKPIASTIEESEAMAAKAKKAGLVLAVGHVERFNPAIRLLKEKLDKFEAGRIFKIEVNRAGPFPSRIRDVGVIIDLAVHDIDIINYLTGKSVEKVYAQTEKKIHTDYEDLLTAIVTYEDNILAVFNTNWLTPFKVRNLSVTGEKGLFHVDFLYQNLEFSENSEIDRRYTYTDIIRGVSEGACIRFPVQKAELLKLELANVLEAVTEQKAPLVTAEDGIKTMRTAFDLLKAADTGSVISC